MVCECDKKSRGGAIAFIQRRENNPPWGCRERQRELLIASLCQDLHDEAVLRQILVVLSDLYMLGQVERLGRCELGRFGVASSYDSAQDRVALNTMSQYSDEGLLAMLHFKVAIRDGRSVDNTNRQSTLVTNILPRYASTFARTWFNVRRSANMWLELTAVPAALLLPSRRCSGDFAAGIFCRTGQWCQDGCRIDFSVCLSDTQCCCLGLPRQLVSMLAIAKGSVMKRA